MAPFPFLQRDSVSEHARQLQLSAYTPKLELEGLLTGIDNVRHDVYLSPKFVETTREHIGRLIARDGGVADLLAEKPTGTFDAPPQIFRQVKEEAPKPVEDFKTVFSGLLIESLNRAKNENNPSLDLLLRLAVVKFFRAELAAQFTSILEKLRAKQADYERPKHHQATKALHIRERCTAYQLNKKSLLRRAGEQLFQTLREIEKETLARLRRALFGATESPAYTVLLNRLMFTEDGRDDSVLAEHYVMLGNFERDADRFSNVEQIARTFLASLDLPHEGTEVLELDPLLNVPDNAQELVGGGTPDESSPKGKAQKALLAAWLEALERNAVVESIIAAYETAPLLAEYVPVINPQQLKAALISKTERGRVEQLLEEHTQLSRASFDAAVKRAGSYRAGDRAKLAGRFLRDYIRYHRDLRSLETLNLALDRVNLLMNDRLRELSAINRTLYEFLLASEQKQIEDKVVQHIILKSDIRDSTTLTRTLFERGLNPASYFSLNFYDPINKLLAKYEATKVFIEGDAVILALFGHEGKQEFPVARTCVLAREMISIVRAYNERSQKDGLPTLELGIGISFQDSAPLYLMDGSNRIMISKALNESDRLSSCNKGARRFLAASESLFNVFSFKTVEDEDTGGNPDEFLMRFNVGGIHISEAAFKALQNELKLDVHELEVPMLWDKEKVRLHSALVPLGGGIFHPIVVREGRIARIEASEFSFKNWTERRYYEVCTNEAIYEFVESRNRAATAD